MQFKSNPKLRYLVYILHLDLEQEREGRFQGEHESDVELAQTICTAKQTIRRAAKTEER